MIRVGINARALAKPNPAGVSRYTYNLIEALATETRVNTDFEYLLFGVESLPSDLLEYDRIQSADVYPPSHSGLHAHRWEQLALPRALRHHDIDVFHTPAGQPPILSGLSRVPVVTTIHDISPVVHPEWFSCGYATLYRILTPLAVLASARVIGVSEFVRNEIIDTYPNAATKTVTIHNGVTPPADPGTPIEPLTAGEFLLFIGAGNRRKNLQTLLSAYRQYWTRADNPSQLALAGPERNVFADLEYEPPAGVHALGYVPDDQLGWLYRNATAFVFPSLYEGFGLPIVEAMHAGTPVITSNQGAMAEIAGNAAHLVDPLDTAHLVKAIERILSEKSYREHLAEQGQERAASFIWERAAAQTVDVYRAVTKQ